MELLSPAAPPLKKDLYLRRELEKPEKKKKA